MSGWASSCRRVRSFFERDDTRRAGAALTSTGIALVCLQRQDGAWYLTDEKRYLWKQPFTAKEAGAWLRELRQWIGEELTSDTPFGVSLPPEAALTYLIDLPLTIPAEERHEALFWEFDANVADLGMEASEFAIAFEQLPQNELTFWLAGVPNALVSAVRETLEPVCDCQALTVPLPGESAGVSAADSSTFTVGNTDIIMSVPTHTLTPAERRDAIHAALLAGCVNCGESDVTFGRNFLPENRNRWDYRRVGLVTSMFIVVLTVAVWCVDVAMLYGSHAALENVQQRQQSLRSEEQRMNETVRAEAAIAKREQAFRQIEGSGVSPFELCVQLGNNTQERVWLRSVTLEEGGKLRLQGRAASYDDFAAYFRDVESKSVAPGGKAVLEDVHADPTEGGIAFQLNIGTENKKERNEETG